MYARSITGKVLEALTDTPVVLIHGARQVGQSTLVEQLAAGAWPSTYLTLDDPDLHRTAVEGPSVAVDRKPRTRTHPAGRTPLLERRWSCSPWALVGQEQRSKLAGG